MHQFLKFIFAIKLYMFQTVPLSIIRSVYSENLLMMDRGTVRNMQSFIPKTKLRHWCI